MALTKISPAPIRTPLSSNGVLDHAWVIWLSQVTGALNPTWKDWTPTLTSTMTISSITITDAQYLVAGPICHFKLYASFTLAGTASSSVFASLPVAQSGEISAAAGYVKTSSALWTSAFAFVNGTNGLEIDLSGQGNYPIGATQIMASGEYRIG